MRSINPILFHWKYYAKTAEAYKCPSNHDAVIINPALEKERARNS